VRGLFLAKGKLKNLRLLSLVYWLIKILNLPSFTISINISLIVSLPITLFNFAYLPFSLVLTQLNGAKELVRLLFSRPTTSPSVKLELSRSIEHKSSSPEAGWPRTFPSVY
jgi:hypothetical protein